MTVRQGITQKLKRLEALSAVAIVHHEGENQLPEIFGRARAAIKNRNKIAHGIWAIGDDGGLIAHRFDIDKEVKRFTDDWPLEKIEKVADDLDNAAGEILDFLRILEPNPPEEFGSKTDLPGLVPVHRGNDKRNPD